MYRSSILGFCLLVLMLVFALGTAILKLINGEQGSWFNIERTKATTSGLYFGLMAVVLLTIGCFAMSERSYTKMCNKHSD